MAAETKDQVRALLDEGKSAKEIASTLEMSQGNVYVHIRNIKKERGDNSPPKRGRPPKLQGKSGEKTEAKPTEGKSESKPAPAAAKANGHSKDEFPQVRAAIEAELSQARRKVVKLEKMLETV